MSHWDGRIVRHWAAELGTGESAFSGSAFTGLVQKDRQDTVLVFTCGVAHIVFIPKRYEPLLNTPPAEITVEGLSNWLGTPLEPAWSDVLAYATTPSPAPALPIPARWMSPSDSSALELLKAACTAYELALAQITMEDPLIVGCFSGELLVGVASTLDVSADIADIGVLTHPRWRGRGIAAGLAGLLRNTVVEQGRVAQYTTMLSNRGSVRTAEKAGFDVFLVEEGYEIPVLSN
jgi:GNAT superfamily N-acetyltransferase